VLEFPFAAPRDGQAQLIRDIEGVCTRGGILLCSAPTGIGKTAAALWPALDCALREDRQLFFVTAKVSQQQLALETLERMLGSERELRAPAAVQIATRERFCPRDGRRCREPICPIRSATSRGAAEVLEDLHARSLVRADDVRTAALPRGLCPFEVSLQLAETAYAVVGDLNYVFDPKSYLRRFFDRDHGRHLLVVDEAHNLADRVAGYASPELDADALGELAALCERVLGPALPDAAEWLREREARIRERLQKLAAERGTPPPFVLAARDSLISDIAEGAAEIQAGYEALIAAHPGFSLLIPRAMPGSKSPLRPRGRHERLRQHGPSTPELAATQPERPTPSVDPLLETLSNAHRLSQISRCHPDAYALIFEHHKMRVACLEPGEHIAARSLGFHASIFMSATLSPFAFHQRRLGLEGTQILTTQFPSPFPERNRCLVVAPGFDTRLRTRDAELSELARCIASVTALRHGNYLAFFPSYRYRDAVARELKQQAGDRLDLLLQLPGLPVERLIQKLRRPHGQSRLLCGVLGGGLSEGVDFPGDLAIGAFVVGPGLPAVSLEREILRHHYDCSAEPLDGTDTLDLPTEEPAVPRTSSIGFELAYVHPGLQRVVQAAGRVIRTPEDRAFILLLGRRFEQPLYRDKLPPDWQRDRIVTPDPVAVIRRFWASHSQNDTERPPDPTRSAPSIQS